MTYEEAIRLIKNEHATIHPLGNYNVVGEQYRMAIDALEKQIEDKPLNIENKTVIEEDEGFLHYVKAIYFDCPCCGERIVSKRYTVAHCPCGQRLDWSDYT